jgi:Asp-tRNA(Asn)/Glu-tRNA(Gln) amidotransferase A subunit family amidase
MSQLTIAGHQFQVPDALLAKYNVGYTLSTEGEAHALQQTFTENLRNNFASKVKAKLENGNTELSPEDQAALQAEFDAYAAKYEFGIRQPGQVRVAKDPVEREVRKMAGGAISERYRAKYNEKPSKEWLDEKVTELLSAGGEMVDGWYKEARDLHKRQQRMHEKAAQGLDALNI